MLKKRRLIGLLFVLALISMLALSACGDDEGDGDDEEPTPRPTATTAEVATEEAAPAETEEAVEATEEAAPAETEAAEEPAATEEAAEEPAATEEAAPAETEAAEEPVATEEAAMVTEEAAEVAAATEEAAEEPAATEPAVEAAEVAETEEAAPMETEEAAEEPVATEEAAPVETEEAVEEPVATEEAAPVETEEAVEEPVATEEAAPVETEEAVEEPVATEEAAPVETEEAAPVETEEAVPVETEEAAPVETEEAAPAETEEAVEVPAATEEAAPVPTEEAVEEIVAPDLIDCEQYDLSDLRIGLVTDVGQINDKSFNQSSWEGVLAAETCGASVDFIETQDAVDYADNIAEFAENDYDIIVTVGFALGTATLEAAATYPDIYFVGVDQFQVEPVDNVIGLVFHEDQSGFLAGVLAARLTESGTIAAVLGTDQVPPVVAFKEGYEAGARYVNPDINIISTYHPGAIDQAFTDPEWGATTARQALDQNADVIFGAGGITGNGALIEVANAVGEDGPPPYCIGVDTDQWDTVPEAHPCLVSSAMKLLDVGVADIIISIHEMNVTPGNYFGVAALAPFHDFEDVVPQEVKDELVTVAAGLADGSISTGYGVAEEEPAEEEPAATEEAAEEEPAATEEAAEEEPAATEEPEATEEAAAETVGGGTDFGVVTVGMNAEYPPFEFVDESGEISGFDVDLVNAIAEVAGFEVELVNTRWDGIFVALQSGEFDMVASAATITEEREEIVDFSNPYFNAGQMIAVPEADAETITSPEDLPGLRVGVQGGTTGDIAVSEIEGVEVVRYDEITLAFQALGAGDIDAIVNDGPVSADIISKNPELGAVLVGDPFTDEFYGIAVQPDLPELLDAVNAALETIIADGTYAQIYQEWFGMEPPTMFQPE
jgi:basic membrane protein A